MLEKADPAASGTAILAAAASPLFGEYAIIVLAAVLGAFCAVTQMKLSHWQSALFVLRCIATSAALTSLFAHLLAPVVTAAMAKMLPDYVALPVEQWIFPVAFVIAVLGDRWGTIWDATGNAVGKLVGRSQK